MILKEKKLDFSGKKVLVIGDVMLDRYVSGHVHRISPEAPVPVLNLQHIDEKPGGAANVAMNLFSLGMEVTLLSVTGDDEISAKLQSILADEINTVFLKDSSRRTSIKTRFMSGNQHLLRLDDETLSDINHDLEQLTVNTFNEIIHSKEIHAIVLQDYNKGLLTTSLIKEILIEANRRKIPTFVDPKEKNFLAYKGCTVFKPNKKEIIHASALQTEDYNQYVQWLKERLHHHWTCLTLGSKGIFLHDGNKGMHFPTRKQEIVDVCGAGDTVLSVLVGCYLQNLPFEEIGYILNIAGGQVCRKPGVAIIDANQLFSEFSLIK